MMKVSYRKLSVALLLPILGWAGASSAETASDLASEGKQVIKQFAGELKSSLQAAVKEGGFTKGIEACSVDAEKIASKHSQGQWTVSRTSLKTRNPDNKPDAWEAKVLADFEQQLKAGKPATQLAAVKKEGNSFRMMKAIPTQGMCLSCHGESLTTDIQKALSEQYPHDRAVGYQEGQIRGAFSLLHTAK